MSHDAARAALALEMDRSGVARRENLVGRLGRRWEDGDIPILCHLPIRLRFALLVGMAVVAAVTFGGVYGVSERIIGTHLAAQDSLRRLNDLAGDVRAGAANLRILEEQFLRDRDPVAVAAFRDEVGAALRNAEAMAATPESGPVGAALTTLRGDLTQEAATFDRVVALSESLGLDEKSGLRGRLAASTRAFEDELKMWPGAADLTVAMLQMRLAERDFMIYGTQAHRNLHRNAANRFDFALDSSPLAPSTREDFRTLLKTYSSDMQAYADGAMALADQVARLRTQSQALQAPLRLVFTYARQGMEHAIAEQETVRRQTGRVTSAVGVVVILLLVAAGLVVARSISQPVRRIERAMGHLARGNHAVEIPGMGRRDEIGDMAKAVGVFKDNAIAMVRLQREQEAIHRDAEAANHRRMLTLAEHFETAVKAVADQVTGNSQAIAAIAERVARHDEEAGADGSLSVVEASARSCRTVAAMADAVAELSSSARDIAAHVATVEQVVREAVEELDRTNGRVRDLAEGAGRIDGVVALIGDIASRTHMLSLNASIEAQRAGAWGKGFAVVAEEVKRLAHQTTDSTREIAAQLATIQAATGDTVEAIAAIGDRVRRMDRIAGQVSQAVAHQGEVTGRIGDCVAEVTASSSHMTDGVVSVTQSAARYGGAALRMMWAAEDLAGPASQLQDEVDGFLGTIRGGGI